MRGEKVDIDKDGKKSASAVPAPEKVQKLMADKPPGKAGLSLSAALLQQVKMGEWNSYTIVALGPETTLKINGIVMCQVVDQQAGAAAKNGVIVLQMHPGPMIKISFKNLRIKSTDSPLAL